MIVERYLYHSGKWAGKDNQALDPDSVQLILAFSAKEYLLKDDCYGDLRKMFPNAEIVLCSTAGEIFDTEVYDNSIAVVAIRFSTTLIKTRSITITEGESSYDAGLRLLESFPKEDLTAFLVLSDGSKVNGSELTKALNHIATKNVSVTGGLAGDGNRFKDTLVGLNEQPREGVIAGIGFYGPDLKVSHGFGGGFETFGLEKKVTGSKANILYEIDGKNALELYKKYLGPEAELLPGAALLFPLSVTLPETGEQVVRTILSIDQEEGSMTFAGDIPLGANVRFMRANFDKIIFSAGSAARQALAMHKEVPQLALLISCVGRKLILKDRTEEGPEAINDVFGGKTPIIGFYSYGEIAPLLQHGPCSLHNQTMTITTFYEAE